MAVGGLNRGGRYERAHPFPRVVRAVEEGRSEARVTPHAIRMERVAERNRAPVVPGVVDLLDCGVVVAVECAFERGRLEPVARTVVGPSQKGRERADQAD